MNLSHYRRILACLALIGFSLASVACSRQAEKRPLQDAAPIRLAPNHNDTAVKIGSRPDEAMRRSLMFDRPEMSSAEYFRAVEDLNVLAQREKNARIAELASEMYDAFYRDAGTHTKTKAHRFYFEAILGEAQPEVKRQMKVLAKDLAVAKERLLKLLDTSAKKFAWPKQINHLSQAVATADLYVQNLRSALPKLGLAEEFSRPVDSAVRDEYEKYRAAFVELSEGLENSQQFSVSVAHVKKAVTKFKVELPEEHAELLEQAENIGKQLDNMETSQHAMTLIVSVWRLVPAEKRAEVFEKPAPDLYSLLSGPFGSEFSLSCYEASPCLNPVIAPVKLIALGKLNSFGVQKIHDLVENAALEFLLKEARKQAVGLLPKIPVQARESLVKQTAKFEKLIGTIQSDFPKFGRERVAKWTEKNFPQDLRGMEAGRVAVKFAGRGNVSVRPVASADKLFSSGAETLGLSLTLAPQFLPTAGKRLRPALLEPVLKLLAVGGFRQLNNQQFPGLLMPISGPDSNVFRVGELLKEGSVPFVVPDSFNVDERFVMNRKSVSRSASVGAQAELLRGIARQIQFLRDWETNAFDNELGKIGVDQLASEIPAGAVAFSVFPKDLLFALAIGNAGAVAQNIVLSPSPVFLLLSKGVLWGENYKQIDINNISAVAAMVGIENGQRGTTVRTADVARYVVALADFVDATKDIEKTSAKPLLEKGENGEPVLKSVMEARKYLRLLQIGLTNFLVNNAQDQSGRIHAAFTLKDGTLRPIASLPTTLEDQALAIRAYLRSSESLELPFYRHAAKDVYFYLNRVLWDSKQQYYVAEIDPAGKKVRAVKLRELALSLAAIGDIVPHLSTEERQQWERISTPWLQVLEDI